MRSDAVSGEALKAFNDLSAGDGFSAHALARIEARVWKLELATKHVGH
jgi:hypothetical protein